MKKIINGKMYNTETAEVVVAYDNGLSYRDFGWCEMTLYRKKTGEYFCVGEGGPMSQFARVSDDGNNRSSGVSVKPLTADEARKWAERYGSADEYIAEFGEPEE